MSPLFDLGFWFDQSPVRFSPTFEYGFFVAFAFIAITAAFLRILSKRSLRDKFDKQAFRMAGNMLAIISVSGFVWLFCTSEEIQIFGMRFWFLVIVALTIVFAIRLYRFVTVEAPSLRIHRQSQADANKYLPRRA